MAKPTKKKKTHICYFSLIIVESRLAKRETYNICFKLFVLLGLFTTHLVNAQ